MPKKKTLKKKKGGRPKIEIDFTVVKALCSVWATEQEIADYLGCTIKTVYRRCKEEMGESFVQYYKKNRTAGTLSLRRAQFKTATETNNPTMLVWLGKQNLGQRDQPEGGEIAAPQPVKIIIQVEDGRKSQSK